MPLISIDRCRKADQFEDYSTPTWIERLSRVVASCFEQWGVYGYGCKVSEQDESGPPFYHQTHQERISMGSNRYLEVSLQVWCAQGDALYRSIQGKKNDKGPYHKSCVCGHCHRSPISMTPPQSSANFPGQEDSSWPPFLAQSVSSSHAVVVSVRSRLDQVTELDSTQFFTSSITEFPAEYHGDTRSSSRRDEGQGSSLLSGCCQGVYQLGQSRTVSPTLQFICGSENKGVLLQYTTQSKRLLLKSTLPNVYKVPADQQPLLPVRRGTKMVSTHTSTHEILISNGNIPIRQQPPALPQPLVHILNATLSPAGSIIVGQPGCVLPPGIQYGTRSVASALWRKPYISQILYPSVVFGHVHEPQQSLRQVLSGTTHAMDQAPKPTDLYNMSTSLILHTSQTPTDVSNPSFASQCLAKDVLNKSQNQDFTVYAMIEHWGFLPPMAVILDPAASPCSYSIATFLSWFVAVENYNLQNSLTSNRASRMQVAVNANLSPKSGEVLPAFPQVPAKAYQTEYIRTIFDQHEVLNVLASTNTHNAYCQCPEKQVLYQGKAVECLYNTNRHPQFLSTSRQYNSVNVKKSNMQDCTHLLQPQIQASIARVHTYFQQNASFLALFPSVQRVEDQCTQVLATLSKAAQHHQAFYFILNDHITTTNVFCGNLTERFVSLVHGQCVTMRLEHELDDSRVSPPGPNATNKSNSYSRTNHTHEDNLTLHDIHEQWEEFLNKIEAFALENQLLPYQPIFSLVYRTDLLVLHQLMQFFQGCIQAKRQSSLRTLHGMGSVNHTCASEAELALYVQESIHSQEDRHSNQCRSNMPRCICTVHSCLEPQLENIDSEKLHNDLMDRMEVLGTAEDIDLDSEEESNVNEGMVDTQDTQLADFENQSTYIIHQHSSCSSIRSGKHDSVFVSHTLHGISTLPRPNTSTRSIIYPSVASKHRTCLLKSNTEVRTYICQPVQAQNIPTPLFFHQFAIPPETLHDSDLTPSLVHTIGCTLERDMIAYICANQHLDSVCPYYDFISSYLGLQDASRVQKMQNSVSVDIIKMTRKKQELVTLSCNMSQVHIDAVQFLLYSNLPPAQRIHHTKCTVSSVKAVNSIGDQCTCCFWQKSWNNAVTQATQQYDQISVFKRPIPSSLIKSNNTSKYDKYLAEDSEEDSKLEDPTGMSVLYCPEQIVFLFQDISIWQRCLVRGAEYCRQFDQAQLLLEAAEINTHIQVNCALVSPATQVLHPNKPTAGLKAIDVYAKQYPRINAILAKLRTQQLSVSTGQSSKYQDISVDDLISIVQICEKTETRCTLSHSLQQCTLSTELVNTLVDDSGGSSNEVKDAVLESSVASLCRKVVLIERGETTAKVTKAVEKKRIMNVFDASQSEIITPLIPTLFTASELPKVEEADINEHSFIYPTCIATSMEVKLIENNTQQVIAVAKVDAIAKKAHLAVYSE